MPANGQPTTDTTGLTQVSLTAYNARGKDYLDTDAAGVETYTVYDDDGRTANVIQNYTAGGVITASTPSDQNLTTVYSYSTGNGVSSVSQLEPNSAFSSSVNAASTVVSGGGSYLMYSANTADTGPLPNRARNCLGSGDVVSVKYDRMAGNTAKECLGIPSRCKECGRWRHPRFGHHSPPGRTTC